MTGEDSEDSSFHGVMIMEISIEKIHRADVEDSLAVGQESYSRTTYFFPF